jgi:hypothetical protein
MCDEGGKVRTGVDNGVKWGRWCREGTGRGRTVVRHRQGVGAVLRHGSCTMVPPTLAIQRMSGILLYQPLGSPIHLWDPHPPLGSPSASGIPIRLWDPYPDATHPSVAAAPQKSPMLSRATLVHHTLVEISWQGAPRAEEHSEQRLTAARQRSHIDLGPCVICLIDLGLLGG